MNDSHYSVGPTSSPLPGIKKKVVVINLEYPMPAWFANDGDSQWLGVARWCSKTADPSLDTVADGDGYYAWTTMFEVPANANLSTISISGLWGSDNPCLDICRNRKHGRRLHCANPIQHR